MMKPDIVYGRVKPVASRLQGMKIRVVTVVYSLNDFTLFEKKGQYLSFVTNEGEYRIYNPWQLKFDINQLLSMLKSYHCSKCGETFISASIIQE